MGTNFYLRVIPSQKRKDALKKAINNNAYGKIKELVQEMYTEPDPCWVDTNPQFGYLHLGKRSGGWRFLWNPHLYYTGIADYYTLFDLTVEGIIKYLKSFDNAYITSEYGLYEPSLDADEGMISVDEFMNMALNWGKGYTFENQYDNISAEAKSVNMMYHQLPAEIIKMLQDKYTDVKQGYAGDFWINDLRFSTSNEFS